MRLRLDRFALYDVFNQAVLVDEEGSAHGAEVLAAVHRLLGPYAHLLDKRVLGVGNEGEGQVVLGFELLMAGGAVYAHANHSVAFLAQLAVVITYAAGLGCAAAGVVLWVEIEYEFLSLKLTEADLLSVLVVAQYLGRAVSDLHSS